MKIISEMGLRSFPAWSGAVDTKNRIIEESLEDEFESHIEELFPDGCTDTELNDYLWFEEDSIFEYLGISSGNTEEEADGDIKDEEE